jgi:ribosomal protein S18 acetylase RimI-like enzyme
MQAYQQPSVLQLQRPARQEDEHLLFALFAEEKRRELVAFGVPAAQAEMLVDVQYRGRRLTYSSQYPQAEDWILLAEDGTPVGRLLTDRKPGRWRVIDIAVLPEHRGKRLATEALRECQACCQKSGSSLALQVAQGNPARRLYERLAFRVINEDTHSVHMVWSADDGVAR